MNNQWVLLDDGQYYVECDRSGDAATSQGFLLRRYPALLATTGGAECVGGYERSTSGKWRAWIHVPYDEKIDSDCHELGVFGKDLDAIVVLWKARHQADGKK